VIDAEEFGTLFGAPPAALAEAFGRVNLIGEHTDYNDGFVLPTSIPQSTVAAVARRTDHRVRAWSAELSVEQTIDGFVLGKEQPEHHWFDYVQGITQALARAGHTIGGFDLALRSTVPLGSGLSSSAALEVAVLRALRDLFALEIDDVEIARLGQQAENDFVGAPPVKLMKPLYGNDGPAVESRNGEKAVQILFRRFAVSVKADEQRRVG